MGHRKDTKHRSRAAGADAAAPALAPGTPELRAQVAVLAGQVRDLGARVSSAARADPGSAPDASERLVAAAERAAAEIREAARREAARIRAQAPASCEAPRDEEPVALLAAARRQRHALAVIAAEIERVEQSAGILRSQLRALDSELANVIAMLSAPAASRDTSRRPRE